MSRSLPPPTVLLLLFLLLLLLFFKDHCLFKLGLMVMLLFYLYIDANGSSNAAGEPKIRCLEVERQALLNIKEALLEIQEGFLSSWGNEEEKRDCCVWYGVQCANNSDHVTVLDLTPSTSPIYDENYNLRRFLHGTISPSLRELKHLTYLDLSLINFTGHGIPSFIGTLTKLRYLNLSLAEMSGEIPPQLGNLSSLEVLDLGYNYFLKMKSMGWVSHLSSLRLLDLSWTNMTRAIDWMQVVTRLPHLTNLQLGECNLPNVTSSSLSFVNSSRSLAILVLSNNQLSVSIYPLVFSFSRSLVHLDLFHNVLEGSFPEAFGNMSALKFLDLSWNEIQDSIPIVLGNMTSLVYLSLSSNKFEGLIPEALGKLTALTDLILEDNHLEGFIPEALGNLTELTFLNLATNYLEGEFPKSLGNLCMLRALNAGGNNLSGLLPFESTQSFPRCTHNSLEYLDLSYNQFRGSLRNLTIFPSLKGVFLSGNQYNGTVPETIGQLAQLEDLHLDGNSFDGVISEAHFSKLIRLSSLRLSDNALALKFNDNWVPPFQLDIISIGSCKLGPQFPRWLQTQTNFNELDISNSRISDSIPDWFWGISSKCWTMDLSHNQINGKIKSLSFEFQALPIIDLSSNNLEGSIPPFLFKAGSLDLAANRFSRISSICTVTNDSPLSFLDISFNQLSGDIPDCWSPFTYLKVLIMANNKFSGEIPISIGSLTGMKTLHLGNNSLTKELPSSLKNCTNLIALDAEENRLEGPVPTWIGESLPELIVLSLRSNHFSGSIPSQLCHLTNLQLLDLSLNNISGRVPRCLKNLTAMRTTRNDGNISIMYSYNIGGSQGSTTEAFREAVHLIWKGKLSRFDKTLGLVKSIDLSSNKLMGEIPTEITQLIQLVSLNLSRNNFSGRIPSKIGKLNLLDALDLSNNQLSGAIPSSLTEVARLNVLDLSNNKLSGKIPTGTQLQSFEASSYTGNPELCGAPLLKMCPGDEPPASPAPAAHNEEEDQDKFITRGFYITLGLGFVVGFWGVCGSLIFNKTWRYSYFNFLNDVNDWIYVMVAVHKAKLLRMIKS